jgi:hypothetical protein
MANKTLEKLLSFDFSADIMDKELLEGVDPERLIAYLTLQGWTFEKETDDIQLWSHANDGGLLVGVTRRFRDYYRSVKDVICAIAADRKKSQMFILKEMLELKLSQDELKV